MLYIYQTLSAQDKVHFINSYLKGYNTAFYPITYEQAKIIIEKAQNVNIGFKKVSK